MLVKGAPGVKVVLQPKRQNLDLVPYKENIKLRVAGRRIPLPKGQ